jgi:hypothetical protein
VGYVHRAVSRWSLWELPWWLQVTVAGVVAVYCCTIAVALPLTSFRAGQVRLFVVLVMCSGVAVELTRRLGVPGRGDRDGPARQDPTPGASAADLAQSADALISYTRDSAAKRNPAFCMPCIPVCRRTSRVVRFRQLRPGAPSEAVRHRLAGTGGVGTLLGTGFRTSLPKGGSKTAIQFSAWIHRRKPRFCRHLNEKVLSDLG